VEYNRRNAGFYFKPRHRKACPCGPERWLPELQSCGALDCKNTSCNDGVRAKSVRDFVVATRLFRHDFPQSYPLSPKVSEFVPCPLQARGGAYPSVQWAGVRAWFGVRGAFRLRDPVMGFPRRAKRVAAGLMHPDALSCLPPVMDVGLCDPREPNIPARRVRQTGLGRGPYADEQTSEAAR